MTWSKSTSTAPSCSQASAPIVTPAWATIVQRSPSVTPAPSSTRPPCTTIRVRSPIRQPSPKTSSAPGATCSATWRPKATPRPQRTPGPRPVRRRPMGTGYARGGRRALARPADEISRERPRVGRRVACVVAAAVGDEHGGQHAGAQRARRAIADLDLAQRRGMHDVGQHVRPAAEVREVGDDRAVALGHAADDRVGRGRLGRARWAAEILGQGEHEQAVGARRQPGGDLIEVALVGGEIEVEGAHVVGADVQRRQVVGVARARQLRVQHVGRRRAVDGVARVRQVERDRQPLRPRQRRHAERHRALAHGDAVAQRDEPLAAAVRFGQRGLRPATMRL